MFARASGNLPLWAVVLNPLMNLSSHLTSLKELPNRRQLNEDGASWPYPILEMYSSMFIALSPWATSPHLQWWWIGWSIQRHSRWWIGPSWFLDGNVFFYVGHCQHRIIYCPRGKHGETLPPAVHHSNHSWSEPATMKVNNPQPINHLPVACSSAGV